MIAYLLPGGEYTEAVLGVIALVGMVFAIIQGRRQNANGQKPVGRTYMATTQSRNSMLLVSGIYMVLLLVLGSLSFHSDRPRSVLVMVIGVIGFLVCLVSWEILRRRPTS